jgi:CHAT domain-containing protein
VGATFLRARYLQGAQATRTQLRASWGRAAIAHFACHAYFEERNPLSSSIGLPSGEQLRAAELLGEPVQGLPLVTLSACRSASVAPLMGQEVFGLVSGLLGAGVRAVVAGLWPVADRETVALMWSFYRHRMLEAIPTALAQAQREALAEPDASPLFWAAFAFFGDPHALPAPGWFTRWWAQRRQAWHAARFPLAQAFPPGD